MQTTNKEQTVQYLAMQCGAYNAQYIPACQIVTDAQFRKICESNSCGRYGRCYQCPPDIGAIEDLIGKVHGYAKAVLYQSVAQIEDSFDFEGMMDAAAAHSQLSQRLHRVLRTVMDSDFLHLSSGCRLCSQCAKVSGLPCRHPEESLGAMEGYGIDVYKTAKNTTLKYNNGENTVTYFGVILFSE